MLQYIYRDAKTSIALRREFRVNLPRAGVNYESQNWRRLSRTLRKSTGRQSMKGWLTLHT